ncbi:MAG: NAD-dependent epimerase/dehydratase family protein [Chloroflexi bacterium]|nr:NAD-dependent epimerase/dehydratase family protein [Chloroflexota bacterium]
MGLHAGPEVIDVRCLVTGGEGFIGSHVVDRLFQECHEVSVLSRSRSPFREELPYVKYIWADMNDRAALQSAVVGVEVVLHLAWSTLPKSSNDDPSFDVEDNVVGTIRLLEHCVSAKVRKVVFASSGGTVYGVPRETPIREGHPTNPTCSYGISKLAVEKYLSLFHRLNGLDWISLRCSNPYGERQNPAKLQGAITTFLQKVASGERIEIWGDGSVVRDYVYVGDVADAFVRAATARHPPCIVNIGSGRGLSLNEVVAHVADVTGRGTQVRWTEARSLDVPVNVLDINRARQVLGWSPTTDLVDGVRRTWTWINSIDWQRKKSDGTAVEKEPAPIFVTIRQPT